MPPLFAALAVVLALGLAKAYTRFAWTPPWWMDAPSVMGIYGIIHKLFDSYGWRWLSPIPNLRGTWTGFVKSSHESDRQSRVDVTIQQTWTRVRISLESAESRSRSLMAAIRTDEEGPGVSYEFLNEPKAVVSAPTMQAHRGTASLHLHPDGERLEGDYYSGRGRTNNGQIQVQRVSSDIVAYVEAIRLAERS